MKSHNCMDLIVLNVELAHQKTEILFIFKKKKLRSATRLNKGAG